MLLLPNASFYIARERRLPDGSRLLNERLSRPMRRVSVAKRVLKRVRRHYPDAYVLQGGAL